MVREDLGEAGDDARPVVDHEPHVVRRLEGADHRRRRLRRRQPAVRRPRVPARDRHQVGDDGDRGRLPARAEPRERGLPPELPVDDHDVAAAPDPPQRRRRRHQGRPHRRVQAPRVGQQLGPRHLPDDAAEPPGVGEVDGGDRGDRLDRNVVDPHHAAEADAGEDRQLGRGVVPVDVVGRVRLGVSEALRLRQRVRERQARALHAGQDVVAGAVQDALDPPQAVARHALPEPPEDGNPPRHRGLEQQVAAPPVRLAQQRGAGVGDDLLVGGHDGLAGGQRPFDPAPGGVVSADQLDDDVHRAVDEGLERIGPDHLRPRPVDALAVDAAVADVRQPHARPRAVGEDARHRPAHRPEAGDAHGASARGRSTRRHHVHATVQKKTIIRCG